MKPYIFILLIILFVFTVVFYRINPLTPTVTISGTTFAVELALTQKEMEKGLSGRSELQKNHGMLFIRDHKDSYTFWMKGMQFPLDFIWIDGNLIVDITENVPILKDGAVSQLKPKVPVDKILELNAGEIKKAGIKIGDTLLFNK